MVIYTHKAVDLDAVASVWFVYKHLSERVFGVKKEEICFEFVPANWNGVGFKDGDLALDIYAGGKGMKGRADGNNKIHSCFMLLLNKYGNNQEKVILKDLAEAIDQHDAFGYRESKDFIKKNIKNFHSFLSINECLHFLKAVYKDEKDVCQRAFDLFDGLYTTKRDEIFNKDYVLKKIETIGPTALLVESDGKTHCASKIVFNSGIYDAYVYINKKNKGIIVKHTNLVKANHPYILDVIKKANEKIGDGGWFVHKSGFLCCWGSNKSPATKESNVNPYDLVKAYNKALAELKNGKNKFKLKDFFNLKTFKKLKDFSI